MVKKLLDSILGRFKKQPEQGGEAARETAAALDKTEVQAYLVVTDEIDRMIAEGEIPGLKKLMHAHIISYTMGNRKVININKHGDPPRTFFLFSGANQLARQINSQGLRPISRNEAKQKSYGPAKAVYTGTDPEVIRSMVKAIS